MKSNSHFPGSRPPVLPNLDRAVIVAGSDPVRALSIGKGHPGPDSGGLRGLALAGHSQRAILVGAHYNLGHTLNDETKRSITSFSDHTNRK